VIGKPWAIRGDDQPDPLDVLPADRLARSLRVLARHVVIRDREPIFALHVRLREPWLEDGDQEADGKEACDQPSKRAAVGDHQNPDGDEDR
jgi:hypothetical protein